MLHLLLIGRACYLQKIDELNEKKISIDGSIVAAEEKMNVLISEKQLLKIELESSKNELATISVEKKRLNEEVEKYRSLIEKKQYAKSKRENNPTNADTKQSTKYVRREETREALEFIHGGKEGSINGAWDFLTANVNNKELEDMVLSFKQGRLVETLYGKFSDTFKKSEQGMNQPMH